MGEHQDTLFRPVFNRAVGVEPSAMPLTEDAGALLLRDMADTLGLSGVVATLLDHRVADRVTHPLDELVLQRVLLLAQGWQDQDDADTLRNDAAFRLAVSQRGGDRALRPAENPREPDGLASQPTHSRLTAMLASEHNRRRLSQGLLHLARERMRRAHGRRRRIVVDVDSYAHETYGGQEGTAYNGHYRVEGYHPLAAFTDTGDIVGVMLRPGNVHTARDVRQFLSPIIDALRQDCDELVIRMDAGYAAGKLFAWLNKRGVRFLTRLPNNPVLRKKVDDWQKKTRKSWAANPTEDGQPRHATREFWHFVKGWTRVVRVVAVTVERNNRRGELFQNTFFLATNYARTQATSEAILKDYRQRAVAETRIGELTRVVAPKLSSAQRLRNGAPHRKRKVGMAENEVTLLLAAIAYQLLHALRCLLEGATGLGFSLDRVRERVLKVAASVVRHARAVRFRIASTKAALWRMLAGALAAFRVNAGVPA